MRESSVRPPGHALKGRDAFLGGRRVAEVPAPRTAPTELMCFTPIPASRTLYSDKKCPAFGADCGVFRNFGATVFAIESLHLTTSRK